MPRRKSTYILISLAALVAILSGVIFLQWKLSNSASDSLSENNPVVKLGFTYLPVTKEVSDYYGLGVSSGAMVTEVNKGGLADQAGVKPGDVITCFNGSQISGDIPLFGLMRACAVTSDLTFDFSSNGCCRLVEIGNSSTY